MAALGGGGGGGVTVQFVDFTLTLNLLFQCIAVSCDVH